MKQACLLLFHFLFLFAGTMASQEQFRVMFYNVENLFDTEKEPNKNDNEFLPTGKKYWNNKKYYQKQNNLAKVITSIGEWSTPALIGMCEVENDKVLEHLTKRTPLKSQKYKFIVTDCDDLRGIDVALLYQPDQFKLLGHNAYKIHFKSKKKISRDILHAYGLIKNKDTLDVFVCHYPSRTGGEKQSEPDRIRASEVLREKADSIYRTRKHANIIIMGDFNDTPSNKSMATTLRAQNYKEYPKKNSRGLQLYNLSFRFDKQAGKGTYKYQGNWEQLDQMIVSGRLLDNTSGCYTIPNNYKIYDADFLFTKDTSKGGKRPKRTYFGMKYEGGFSDHLPIYADFYITLRP